MNALPGFSIQNAHKTFAKSSGVGLLAKQYKDVNKYKKPYTHTQQNAAGRHLSTVTKNICARRAARYMGLAATARMQASDWPTGPKREGASWEPKPSLPVGPYSHSCTAPQGITHHSKDTILGVKGHMTVRTSKHTLSNSMPPSPPQ